MRKIVVFLTVSALLGLYGCGHVFNPYSSSFQCPEPYKGACVDTKTAYNRSLHDKDKPQKKKKKHSKGQVAQVEKKTPTPEDVYRKDLYTKLSGLIEAPRTPVVVPPDVGRALILSYTGDDNTLFSYRYVYFFLNEPRWVLTPVEDAKK